MNATIGCMPKIKLFTNLNLEILLILLTALLVYQVDFSTDYDEEFYFKKEDIYYEYQAAKQLQEGENPYNRILESNMLENDKYATQFPLYFYFLSYIKTLANHEFSGFIEKFRVILFQFQLLGGAAIYLIFRRINKKFIGLSAALFYMFNVWTLNSFLFLKQDMIAIALLLFSLYFFRDSKIRWLAYVLYGLSLGIKHIGIFVAPLYLTPLLFKEDSPKKFGTNLALLIATVLIPTLPFLQDNAVSFYKSMLFSLTRAPFSSEILFGYSGLLITYNPGFNTGTLLQQLTPRLPLLIASLFAVVMLLLRKIPKFAYAFVGLMVFAIFNPVIFPQYITWLPPLALVAMVDFLDKECKN